MNGIRKLSSGNPCCVLVLLGVVEQRWKSLTSHDRCDIELVMRGNSLQVINEQSVARLVTDELVNPNIVLIILLPYRYQDLMGIVFS